MVKVMTAVALVAAAMFGGAAPAVATYECAACPHVRCSDPNACVCVDQHVAGYHIRKCTL